MAGMEGLGRVLDISGGFVPVDINTANSATGFRASMRNCSGLTIVVFKAAGTAGDDPTLTVQQHTAKTAGTTASLATVDHYYIKAGAPTLAGTETWSKITQTAAATIVDPGGAGTSAESEMIIAIEVLASQLTNGYDYVSVNYAVAGLANAQLACALYFPHDLSKQRKPSNLAAVLS